jgi:hypothetical protein
MYYIRKADLKKQKTFPSGKFLKKEHNTKKHLK